jgi:hypothetical protein
VFRPGSSRAGPSTRPRLLRRGLRRKASNTGSNGAASTSWLPPRSACSGPPALALNVAAAAAAAAALAKAAGSSPAR